MISINPGQRHDIYYRYKMPVPEVRHQGRNQATKTEITNIGRISLKLRRQEDSIIRFITMTLKTRQDKGMIRGRHTSEDILNVLDLYIENYILCKTCQNPETEVIEYDGNLGLCCRACGFKYQLHRDQMYTSWYKEAKKIGKGKEYSGGIYEDTFISSLSDEDIKVRQNELAGRTSKSRLRDLFKENYLDSDKYIEIQEEAKWSDADLIDVILSCFTYRICQHLFTGRKLWSKFSREWKCLFLSKLAEWIRYHYPESWVERSKYRDLLVDMDFLSESLIDEKFN